MIFRDFVQLLRRRLLLLAAGLVVGALVGWWTAPARAPVRTFRATATLIYEGHGSQGYNIGQVALLATSGGVPSRVAARLNKDRAEVRAAVSADVSADVSTISITGRSADPSLAVSLADVTAEELAAEIAQRDQAVFDVELTRLVGAVDTARTRLNAIPAKNVEEQAAARGDLAAQERALEDFRAAGPAKSQLRTLEKASPAAVGPAGVRAPDSKPVRAGLLGGFGLLAGLAGAVSLDRIDSRIRSKRKAEAAFGAPVVTEVPAIPKSSQGQLLTHTAPAAAFVEAYRALRTFVALWTPSSGVDDGHRVIVVTSPGAGEGKTTTVAHLAAMLAEVGRSVLVISADLRRPRLQEYFDRSSSPGLMDVVSGRPDAPAFSDLDLSTPVRGVRFVPSGPAAENPAPVLEHSADLVALVRDMADFVLIDTPPLLMANDAAELARHADGVLLVARSGRTPIEAAERTAEILQRLEVPLVGAVLVGSDTGPGAYRYYGSRYYAEPERAGRLRRRTPA